MKKEKENKVQEVDEEFKDVKDKSKLSKIVNVTLWVLLVAWMGICVFDFVRVKTEHTPVFCVSRSTKDYRDGHVDQCIGLGYKVYHYERESIQAIEFKPLWAKERLSDLK